MTPRYRAQARPQGGESEDKKPEETHPPIASPAVQPAPNKHVLAGLAQCTEDIALLKRTLGSVSETYTTQSSAIEGMLTALMTCVVNNRDMFRLRSVPEPEVARSEPKAILTTEIRSRLVGALREVTETFDKRIAAALREGADRTSEKVARMQEGLARFWAARKALRKASAAEYVYAHEPTI